MVEYIVMDCPGISGQTLTGGGYAYGRTEVRDYWTGALVAERQWCSGSTEFDWCPLAGTFGKCGCDTHDDLYPPVVESWRLVEPEEGGYYWVPEP